MTYIAGVDIGNSTTEVCIGEVAAGGGLTFLASSSTATTGTKGTPANVHGIMTALKLALDRAHLTPGQLSLVRLNEAAPVIGDTAMETLTETVITDSSMIGHNPSTPAGAGQAVGLLLPFELLEDLLGTSGWVGSGSVKAGSSASTDAADRMADELRLILSGASDASASKKGGFILYASEKHSYEEVAALINRARSLIPITGAILQADEAVLVENRLDAKIPIIDEVLRIDKLPAGIPAAIEVAAPGQSIYMLSNPYGIATLLELTPEQTKSVTPIARSLIGNRSAVVLKTPGGNVHENVLPAGELYLAGDTNLTVNLDEGAQKIMEAVRKAGHIHDITGQSQTNVGNMFARIKGNVTEDVHITDILAVDTLSPVRIAGALAGETCLEKAVGIAAMVKTRRLPMQEIAASLQKSLSIPVHVAGVEAVMASLGALTTPGSSLPLAILDMGGGSTDAAVINDSGHVHMTHQAGAGELVSMLIETELGLGDRRIAEQIKKYPLAKVESLFHMRMESGEIRFVDTAIDPRFFGRVILLSDEGYIRIEKEIPMEKIRQIRREAKKKVFVTNALRALQKVAPEHNLKALANVVLVGGSALDFEIPEMLMDALSDFRIVCGRGNIRGEDGPRNAVATGLVLSYLGEGSYAGQ